MLDPRKITHWLVRDDQPFNGHSQSFLLPDGTVAYTGGMTPREYSADRGFPVRVITDAEFDALIADHERRMLTAPGEETESDFWDALKVLPPCRWHRHRGVELFHISERITGRLVTWHAQLEGRFFSFVDVDNATREDLARKVRDAAQA